MARRGLRGAAESLALVGYGLLTLDVVGADHAGWFGDLSDAGLLVLLGVVLAAAGTAGLPPYDGPRHGALAAGEVVAAWDRPCRLVCLGVGLAAWLPVAPSLVLATLLAAGAVRGRCTGSGRASPPSSRPWSPRPPGSRWCRWPWTACSRTPRGSELWAGLHVWPLLVAAGLVAALALVPRLPLAARVTGASLGELLLVCAVVAPFDGATATTQVAGRARRAGGRRGGLLAAAATLGAERRGHPGGRRDGAARPASGVQASLAAGRLLDGAGPGVVRRADRPAAAADRGRRAGRPGCCRWRSLVLLATLAVLAEAQHARRPGRRRRRRAPGRRASPCWRRVGGGRRGAVPGRALAGRRPAAGPGLGVHRLERRRSHPRAAGAGRPVPGVRGRRGRAARGRR